MLLSPQIVKSLAEELDALRSTLRMPRNILLVCPRFPLTVWGLRYTCRDILAGPHYPLPPLPLLTLAAFLPSAWNVRLIDENVHEVEEQDLAWADLVCCSCMLVQKEAAHALTVRAHALHKPVAVGGPHATSCPDAYAEADYVHVGEVGDGTVAWLWALAAQVGRPEHSRVFRTTRKLPVTDYPVPRYDLIRPGDYLSSSLQFAVGCPFQCEFCEIPMLYGRNPRVKTPPQVLAELDNLLASGCRGGVFFVDDNFIGNVPKVKQLLPHLVRWQQEKGFPFQFYTEASVNLADHPDLLEQMREAGFYAVFLGIETPKAKDLIAIGKSQNARGSLMEAVRRIQRHGLEIWAGIIFGFDSDDGETGRNIQRFVEESTITLPMLNLLGAPPATNLRRRLEREGRLLADPQGTCLDTNVLFKQGQKQVVDQFVAAWAALFEPRAFLGRIRRNNRLIGKSDGRYGRLLPVAVQLRSLPRLILRMGILAPYRLEFWRLFLRSLCDGTADRCAYQMAMAYHFIKMREAILAAPPAAGHAPAGPVTTSEAVRAERSVPCANGPSGSVNAYDN